MKFLTIVLVLVAPMTVAAPSRSPYASNLEIRARRAAHDFVPDGNLDKAEWNKAQRLGFDHDWSGKHHFPGLKTDVATVWTGKYLYVAFWSKYHSLNVYEGEDPARERRELWNRDVVEAFVNPQPDRVNHYYEFEVAPTNQWVDLEIDLDKKPFNDAGWNSGYEHATRLDSARHTWTCEMRIPVASMKAARIEPNSAWRINFYRAAGQGDDAHRQFLAWSPVIGSKGNFHFPTRFGLIRFLP